MRFLRQNTAVRVTVGPFLDKTDGITPETGLTATNEHLTLIVDDGNVPTLVLDANATASGGNNDFVHITNDDAGFYDLELTAAQTNYVGRAMLSINYATDHCPVFHEFIILPANIYDSLVLGTDYIQSNVKQLNGTNQTARDIGASVLLSSGTGTGQISLSSGSVTVSTNNDKTGYALTTTEHTNIADAILKRDWTAVTSEASRSILNALRILRNKWTISSGTMTIYKEDDSTPAWTASVTGTSGADPITTFDP